MSFTPAIRSTGHQRREVRMMPMKKLASRVWKPSAVSVTPGTDEPHRARVVELPERVDAPDVHRRGEQHEAARQHDPASAETALQRDDAEEDLHAPVRRQQAFGDREGLREDGEDNRPGDRAGSPGSRTAAYARRSGSRRCGARAAPARIRPRRGPAATAPGSRNSQRGLYIRKNRSVRQPSRNVLQVRRVRLAAVRVQA